MRFGIREICNVVFRAKAKQTLGSRTFFKDEPVLYFDTLKTSGLEGAATSVYAQGGRGNPRLVVWEGERTVTFTMEDALISKEGLAILTGAGLIDAKDANSGHGMFVHMSDQLEVLEKNKIIIPDDYACWTEPAIVAEGTEINAENYTNSAAAIFVMVLDDTGSIVAEPCIPAAVEYKEEDGKPTTIITCYGHDGVIEKGSIVLVDYYVKRTAGATQIEITADKFGGAYYIEADTLFRREGDNVDMPANFIIPNGKVQSNFNFAMAATGDPSTFTFTVDALPDYTKFDRTHKVLVAIQMIEDETTEEEGQRQPCVEGQVTDGSHTFKEKITPKNAGVTADLTESSSKAATITLSGKNVTPDALNKAMFGDYDGKATVVEISMPTRGDGKYKIVNTNPSLKYYFGKDDRVTIDNGKYVKTQKITLTPDDTTLDLQVLVGDSKDDITIKFYKDDILIRTYTIVSKDLSFAA